MEHCHLCTFEMKAFILVGAKYIQSARQHTCVGKLAV